MTEQGRCHLSEVCRYWTECIVGICDSTCEELNQISAHCCQLCPCCLQCRSRRQDCSASWGVDILSHSCSCSSGCRITRLLLLWLCLSENLCRDTMRVYAWRCGYLDRSARMVRASFWWAVSSKQESIPFSVFYGRVCLVRYEGWMYINKCLSLCKYRHIFRCLIINKKLRYMIFTLSEKLPNDRIATVVHMFMHRLMHRYVDSVYDGWVWVFCVRHCPINSS